MLDVRAALEKRELSEGAPSVKVAPAVCAIYFSVRFACPRCVFVLLSLYFDNAW